jgi:hypothetical protein
MNRDVIRSFRRKIQKEAVLGPFMKTGDPAFVEVAGYAGCDFAILDMEHGPESLQGMQNNIRAAQLTGMLPVVRVSSLSEVAISQALDIGAADYIGPGSAGSCSGGQVFSGRRAWGLPFCSGSLLFRHGTRGLFSRGQSGIGRYPAGRAAGDGKSG